MRYRYQFHDKLKALWIILDWLANYCASYSDDLSQVVSEDRPCAEIWPLLSDQTRQMIKDFEVVKDRLLERRPDEKTLNKHYKPMRDAIRQEFVEYDQQWVGSGLAKRIDRERGDLPVGYFLEWIRDLLGEQMAQEVHGYWPASNRS